MRVNWFSPLPPAPTDIAHYTRRILPALASKANVCIWTTAEQWDPSVEEWAAVERYTAGQVDWPRLHEADVTFFNLGNDARFHSDIWRVAREHPGVVVLHDVRLHEAFLGMCRARGNDGRSWYCSTVTRLFGAAAGGAAADVWDGRVPADMMLRRYSMAQFALEGAIAGVVHGAHAKEMLGNVHLPVLTAPLPYVATGRPNSSPRHCNPPYSLVIFGYLGRNRRIGAVLDALVDPAVRQSFKLSIYGYIAEEEQLLTAIRVRRLEDVVSVHGFVPEDELEAALDRADLAINLRFPTTGEASGSQLRIWDHSLPSVVTRVGWYATLPTGTVAYVRPDHESEDLSAHLTAFAETPSDYQALGVTGHGVLRAHHGPADYVDRLIELAERADGLHSAALWQRAATRVGEASAVWAAPAIAFDVPGAVNAIREIYPPVPKRVATSTKVGGCHQ